MSKQNSVIKSGATHTDKYLLFAFATVFFSVLLWLVFRKGSPLGPDEADIVHLISALSAAGFGAMLPGHLEIQHKGWLRAGGAIALFILVFIYQPERRIAPQNWPIKGAEKAVEDHLKLIDSGDFRKAYSKLSEEGKKRFSESEFLAAYENGRRPFGAVRERVMISMGAATALPDGTQGSFKILGFRTTFSSGQVAQEPVWVIAEGDEWHVLFHNVSLCPDPTCGGPPR